MKYLKFTSEMIICMMFVTDIIYLFYISRKGYMLLKWKV